MEIKNRKIENSIEAFYDKCAKLNVPPAVMPEHQFLKRIFRGYLSPFECFTTPRVDTKKDIELVRDVILVHKMKDIKMSTIKNSNSKLLPEELRRYLEYQKCCDRIQTYHSSSLKIKEREVLERVKKNDVNKRHMEKELSLKRSRIDVLQALSNKLNDDLKTEEEIGVKVDSNKQVLKAQNEFDDANLRVIKTVELLREFSAKGITSSVNKERCWKEVENNIYSVPNALTFDILNNLLKSKAEDPLFQETAPKRSSIQEAMLDKLRELKIKIGFELIASRRDVEDLKKACSNKIQNVENQLESLLDSSTLFYDDDDDDIVGAFSSALSVKLIQEGKMKHLEEKIKPLKNQSETNVNFFENLMQSIQDSNQMISDKVNAIQFSIAQAHLINEKSKFSNMKLMRNVNNIKLDKHQQTNRTMLNQTVSGFIENSTESGVQTELELFLVSPMHGHEKIDLKLEHLLASSPITQLFTNNLASFIKSLKLLQGISQSAQKCTETEIPSPLSPAYILDSQFFESLKKQCDENQTDINEIFEIITRMNVNIKGLFGNFQTIYKFVQENALKKFIDPKQKYENKTYLEFEKEYMMYYKMIK